MTIDTVPAAEPAGRTRTRTRTYCGLPCPCPPDDTEACWCCGCDHCIRVRGDLLTLQSGDLPPGQRAPGTGLDSVDTADAEALTRWLNQPARSDTPSPEPPATPPEPETTWWAVPADFEASAAKLPAALRRDDDATIIYANKVSWISGVGGIGKSWIGLICAIAAERAIFVDTDDQPPTMGQRARLLGAYEQVSDVNRFRYTKPHNLYYDFGDGDAADLRNRDAAIEWLGDGILVLDNAGGLRCPQDGSDVRPWIEAVIEPWRRRHKPTIIVLDHRPKRAAGRAPGPIGSEYKVDYADGAVLDIAGKPWNLTEGGSLTLTVVKDRHGQLPAVRDDIAATIRATWQRGGFAYTITPPKDGQTTQESVDLVDARADIERRILTAVGNCGDIGITSATALHKAVGGRKQTVLSIASQLASDGLLAMTEHGRSHRYVLTSLGSETLDMQ